MQFLGTGAADMIPNPFCECPICAQARSNPSLIRARSAFLLNEESLIDFGPDIGLSCARHGIDITRVKHVFITHTHEDHFCLSNAGLLLMSRTRGDEPLDVFLSEKAFQWLSKLLKSVDGKEVQHLDIITALNREYVRFIPVQPGKTFDAGGYHVLAVETEHQLTKAPNGERAVNYLFEDDCGRKLLYACDTGLYTSKMIDQLRGACVDVLIMEATFGDNNEIDLKGHLNAEGFLLMLEMFRSSEIITAKTQVYATHINHKHSLTATLYQNYFDIHSQQKVIVAADGMCI